MLYRVISSAGAAVAVTTVLTALSPPGPEVADGEGAGRERDGGRLPAALVAVGGDEGPATILVVEKASQALFVFEAGPAGPTLVRRLPCTTGQRDGDKRVEGDLRTPEGVYWFTRYIPGDQLPPLYGAGAFVMDYPNRFDVLDRKSGGGIWLHGVESNDRVLVRGDTRGCVAVRNDHFEELRPSLRLRETPIVVVEGMDTAPRAALSVEARAIGDLIEDWRRAWERKDLDRYLAHYGEAFEGDGRTLAEWAAHKRRLAERYGTIRVSLGPPTILRDKDRLWVRFRQEYASDAHADVGSKVLSLRASADAPTLPAWRIVGEEWRPLPAAPSPPARPRPFVPGTPRVRAPAPPAGQAAIVAAALPRPAPGAAPVARPAPEPPAAVVATLLDAPPPHAAAGLAAQAAPAPGAVVEAARDAGGRRPPAAPDEPAAPAAVEAAAPAAPSAAAGPLVLAEASLAAPRLARRAFELALPFAHESAGRVEVSVQLLNATSSFTRSGELEVIAFVPGAGEIRDAAPARFTTKQGLVVSRRLPRPDQAGRIVLRVQVRDDAARAVLDQDVVVEVSAG